MNNQETPVSEANEQTEEVIEEVVNEPKMVPLTALQAERKKRQEAEARNQLYEEHLEKKGKIEPEEDPSDLLTKGTFAQEKALTKREIREELFQEMNPKAVVEIEKYLDTILQKKPWLVTTIDNAPNRYARAYEIVTDYMHLVEKPSEKKSAPVNEAKRIIENSMKPRSPAEAGRTASPSGTEFLKSIQGKKEFREYRQKLMRGEV